MKEEYYFSKGRRRALEPIPPGKTRITIRLDNDILEWFHQKVEAMEGGNYQTLTNNASRQYATEQKEPCMNLGSSSYLGAYGVLTA